MEPSDLCLWKLMYCSSIIATYIDNIFLKSDNRVLEHVLQFMHNGNNGQSKIIHI